MAHSMTGRKDAPQSMNDGVPETCLWNFHAISTLKSVPITRVIAGPNATHYLAIDREGGLYVWGRNERGQLGLGHTTNVYGPTKVTNLPPVRDASAGRAHTLVLTAGGDIYSAGDNKMSQCSTGKGPSDAPVLRFTRISGGPPAGQAAGVAAGSDFSLAVDSAGRVYSCGSQQYGQCGTGTTGEWIVSAGKTAFAEIPTFAPINLPAGSAPATAVAAGCNHGVALTSDGQAYSWGCGGYGRLGHGVPADELRPRAIKAFEVDRMRVKSISCGATATWFILRMGDTPYYCGIMKKSGEAAMTPKYYGEMPGWKVRVASTGNTSTIFAVEHSVVSFGPSPTSGELGYGEGAKSSTKAKLVDDLEGCYALDVSMGLGASLVLLDTTSDTPAAALARKRIEEGKIPTYTPEEPAPSAGSKRKAEDGAGSGTGAKGPVGAGAGSGGGGAGAGAGAGPAKKKK